MLETKNLVKIYKPKKGEAVRAINGINLRFPEKGMVFLLGKSGSGKSTLLNLLGGLDRYDEGEIIIKGVSSKDFTQKRFDSYRNTYVGFIFQDYNILQEFNVGANIALALELQGKKATDEAINSILNQVDLAGFGHRKPSELSGGQLQRVAIARALVKNPEIIMADEPTGALDSATGKQVFDTLKKLSEDKLVIIVSHDREYAEFYADRIIELSDGQVITDVTYDRSADRADERLTFDRNTITVPAGYHLTEEDRLEINAYIDRVASGVGLHFSGLKKAFKPTDTTNYPYPDPAKFSLINSKLPIKSAARIGASSLKHKKFRLVVTIFLSVVAFTLFGLSDTIGAYNHVKTCVSSIVDTGINYASFEKNKKMTDEDGERTWWGSDAAKMEDTDLAEISKRAGIPVKGVYVPWGTDLGFAAYTDLTDCKMSTILSTEFAGFTELTDEDLQADMGKLVAGKLPTQKGEIAVSAYICETFMQGGFATGELTVDEAGFPKKVTEKITSAKDLLDRTIKIGDDEYKIVGVVDVGFDFERYESLWNTADEDEEGPGISTAELVLKYVLSMEMEYVRSSSLNCLVYVPEGTINEMVKQDEGTIRITENGYFQLFYYSDEYEVWTYPNVIKSLDAVRDSVVWTDGVSRETLSEKEIVISETAIGAVKSNMDKDDYSDGFVFPDDVSLLNGLNFNARILVNGDWFEEDNYRIVGVAVGVEESFACVSEGLQAEFEKAQAGTYSFAVGPMPTTEREVLPIVEQAYDESGDYRYALRNSVVYELDMVNEILNVLGKVFMWVGIGFALFAALMLANFIATSINYKKQEIGILRAIGSRSNDVFRIFFSESFIIAFINFVLSVAAVAVITYFINNYIRQDAGILITVLRFSIRQVLLLAVISVGVAFAASFIPVKRIAAKRPIDAIRGR